MKGSLYMTVAVTKTLARLQNLTSPSPEVTNMIKASFRFMDKKVAKCVAEMKRDEKKYNTILFPSVTFVIIFTPMLCSIMTELQMT